MNSKLKNKKFYFELLLRKLKNKILISKSLEISSLKRNVTQLRIFWKKCRHVGCVISDINLVVNIKRYCLWSWYYSEPHALRYAIVFFEKNFCFFLVSLLVNTRYLYEYWDSNGWCKFIDTSIYKITEDHSVAASQTKNDHI